jgi:hypothetical protein
VENAKSAVGKPLTLQIEGLPATVIFWSGPYRAGFASFSPSTNGFRTDSKRGFLVPAVRSAEAVYLVGDFQNSRKSLPPKFATPWGGWKWE